MRRTSEGGSRIRCRHSSSLWYVCVREGGLGAGLGAIGGGGFRGAGLWQQDQMQTQQQSVVRVCGGGGGPGGLGLCVWGGAGLCSVPD